MARNRGIHVLRYALRTGRAARCALAQSAALLVAQAGGELDEIDTDPSTAMRGHSVKVAFQIWEGGKRLRLRSAGAPAERLAERERGFSDVSLRNKTWRVFSTWDGAHRHLVQVAEERHLRDEIVEEIAESLLVPFAFALPVLAALLWLAVAQGIHRSSASARTSSNGPPTTCPPLDARDAAGGIAPLVDNLNRLFGRVGELLERERQFTADAAHELRTPLAALRAQAQVARAETHAAKRDRALDNVIAGCDRAARLVEQLLTLARLEPEELKTRREPCDIARLARDAVADAVPFALDRDVEIELDAPAPLEVSGAPDLLRILVRNLVDNAVRYSPARGIVSVSVAANQRRLTVLDQGPGVPPEERGRLGERFHRVLGTGQSGSGLGLSIVKRIAELHDARLGFRRGRRRQGIARHSHVPRRRRAGLLTQRTGVDRRRDAELRSEDQGRRFDAG